MNDQERLTVQMLDLITREININQQIIILAFNKQKDIITHIQQLKELVNKNVVNQ